MPRRYFHRSDLNSHAIVAMLRKLGIRVHCWGEEADLIAQWQGLTMLCEVRQAGHERKPRKGRQAEFQKEFCVKWLQTDEDCLGLLDTFKRWHRTIRSGT